MKKLLALLLALLLATSCVSALAAMPDLENGVTVAAAMNFDAEAVMALATQAGEDFGNLPEEAMTAAFGIINNLGVKAAVKGTDAQIDLLLKDASVLALNLGVNESGIVVTCDAIPNYAFTISAETIQQLMNQIAESMPKGLDGIDPEALGEAIGSRLGALIQEVLAKAGETETGSFNVDGMDFNARIPLNITTKELALLTMNFVKDVLNDPAFAPVLGMIGDQLNLEDLDDAIQELEGLDEAQMPVTEAFVYGQLDEAGNANSIYVAIDISQDGQTIATRGGMVGNHILGSVKVLDQGTFKLDAEIKDNGANVAVTVEAQGMTALATLDAAARADGGVDLRGDISLNGSAPLFTGYLSVVPGAEIAAPASAEGKICIALEDLMNNDSEATQNAMTALQSAAIVIMGKAMQVMPDEFNVIMTMVNGGQAQMY